MTRVRRFLLAVAVCGSGWVLPMPVHAADSNPYTVQDGDSLYGIAAKSGVDLSALLDANDLTLTSVIVPGQHLSIPTDSSSSSSSDAGSTYTVTWGDSLSQIAGRHQVSLSSLLDANDLTASSLILPGMRLRLPADSTTASATPTKTADAAPSTASYTVTWGDSLSQIAGRHQVSLSSLLDANDLTASSLILPGMRLRLPADSTTASATPTKTADAAPSTASYTVTWGDSLSQIAGRHQVSLSSLLDANDLTASSLILPGRRLRIPAGATAPSPASPITTTSSEPPGDEHVGAVVRYTIAQQGKPYEFFTKGPDSFDCSGLTLAAYAQAGIQLVHHSAAQARQGTEVDLSSESIRPGDLVFLKRRGSATINHVGIAIDADTWIQATGYGDTVRAGSMPASSSIVAVRRFINP